MFKTRRKAGRGTVVRREAICFILSLVLTASSVGGSEAKAAGADWPQRLAALYEGLRQGHFEDVAGEAAVLGDDMALLLVPGEKSSKLLAAVVGLRAVAEAEMGRRDDALWHWRVAQGIHPGVFGMELPVAGDGVAFLRSHPRRTPGTFEGDAAAPDAELVPPVPLEVPLPRPPDGLEDPWSAQDGSFEVEVVVDAEGRVRSPVVLEGGALPGKVYFGLRALREWRFWPARSGGEVVPALVRLSDFRSESRGEAFDLARDRRLGMLVELLVTGRHEEALTAARAALDEALACGALLLRFSAQASEGPAVPAPCNFAAVVALEALAEIGSAPGFEALWSWYEATSLNAWLPDHDLHPYHLDRELLAELEALLCASTTRPSCDPPDLADHPELLPPRAEVAPAAAAPPEVADLLPDRVVVRLALDSEGRPWRPRVVAGGGEVATYLALEALRRWRFEPARTAAGDPVAVVWEVTVPFEPAASDVDVRF